jgi:hypothetical protein
MLRLIHTEPNGIKVYPDTEWQEYRVTIPGNPNASYHTDDKADALSHAKSINFTKLYKSPKYSENFGENISKT